MFYEDKNAQLTKEIYSFGKSPDSPAGFGLERAEEVNRRNV
jgi:hypothetical protein